MICDIIAWIIMGAIAGWVASKVTNTDASVNGSMNIVVGIVGALVGGFVLRLFGATPSSGFNFGSLLTAILGAVVLLGVIKLFRRNQV